MPLLIVTSNEIKLSQRFLVREERFAIGRSGSSAVPIPDKSVSKSHVMVSRTPSGYFFQDLFSANGTYLNEERRDAGLLKDGDVLRLGRINITFLLDEGIEGAGDAGSPPGPRDPAMPPPAARPKRAPPDRGLPARRRKRILAAYGIGAMGLLIGFMIGRIDLAPIPDRRAAEPEDHGAGVAAAAIPPAPDLTEKAEKIASVPEDGNAGEEEAPEPLDEKKVEEIAAEYRDGLLRPYADPEESRRVLFRLFLDILDRPPTRAEAKEFLALDHAQRWRRIGALAPSEPPSKERGGAGAGPENGNGKAQDAVTESFRRFLGRAPTPSESQAFERGIDREPAPAAAPGEPGKETLKAGLLITASSEYRSAGSRREKARQKARALIVDLLDHPPASEAEVLEVEKALNDFPRGRVARVLAFSPEGTRALPVPGKGVDPAEGGDGARGGAKEGLREWAREEIFRFLLRSPSDVEIEKVLEEIRKGGEGPRRLRIALAGLAEYRSY